MQIQLEREKARRKEEILKNQKEFNLLKNEEQKIKIKTMYGQFYYIQILYDLCFYTIYLVPGNVIFLKLKYCSTVGFGSALINAKTYLSA